MTMIITMILLLLVLPVTTTLILLLRSSSAACASLASAEARPSELAWVADSEKARPPSLCPSTSTEGFPQKFKSHYFDWPIVEGHGSGLGFSLAIFHVKYCIQRQSFPGFGSRDNTKSVDIMECNTMSNPLYHHNILTVSYMHSRCTCTYDVCVCMYVCMCVYIYIYHASCTHAMCKVNAYHSMFVLLSL